MKYFYILFLSALIFLFLPASVSAMTAEEYAETVDIFDVYIPEEYKDSYYEVGYVVRPFSLNDDKYQKDEQMQVTSMQWFSYYLGNMNGSSNLVFGSYIQRNPDNVLKLYIKNDGKPLFSEGGQLGLEVCTRGKNCTLTATRIDGSVSVIDIPNYVTSEVVSYVTFDNTNADIVELCLYIGNITTEFDNAYRIYGSFLDYGYCIESEEPEPEPEPDIDVPQSPVFTGHIVDSLIFIMAASFAYIESLFLLDIVSGLSLGYFLFAVMIFSLIFGFFLHKIVK